MAGSAGFLLPAYLIGRYWGGTQFITSINTSTCKNTKFKVKISSTLVFKLYFSSLSILLVLYVLLKYGKLLFRDAAMFSVLKPFEPFFCLSLFFTTSLLTTFVLPCILQILHVQTFWVPYFCCRLCGWGLWSGQYVGTRTLWSGAAVQTGETEGGHKPTAEDRGS